MLQTLCVILCSLLLCGCCEVQSPRAKFLLENRQDCTNYVELYEVSVESLQKNEDRIHHIITNMVQNIRQDVKQCSTLNGNCEPINQRLERIQTVDDYLYKENVGLINKLKKVYDPKTDTIFYYNYSFQEFGWMIVDDKTIKMKVILEKP